MKIQSLTFDRTEIERGNSGPALKRLRALSESPQAVQQLASHLVLFVGGYDDDPRELYEIPQCRAYFRKLAHAWDGWLYFLEKDHGSIGVLMCLLTDVDVVDRSTSITSVAVRDVNQAVQTQTDLLAQLQRFCERHGLGDDSRHAMSETAYAAMQRAVPLVTRAPRVTECASRSPVPNVNQVKEPLATIPLSMLATMDAYAAAIADRRLVDVFAVARGAGISVPIALSRAAWADCVEWADADAARTGAYQDEAGRLWDVVFMCSMACQALSDVPATRVPFELYRVSRAKRSTEAELTELVARIGGTNGAPFIVVGLPGEL